MNPASSRQMLISSDYPADKVILLTSGSFSLPGSNYPTINIPHTLPFTPLISGSWSTTSDFSITYELDSGPLSFSDPTFRFNQYVGAAVNSNNIRINAGNNLAGGVTIYYRLFYLQPEGFEDSETEHTASSGSDFLVNTDQVITKLFAAGSISQAATGASIVTQTLAHNLGVLPQVTAWENVAGYVRPITTASNNGIVASIAVDTVNVYFITELFSNAKTYLYRVYLDV